MSNERAGDDARRGRCAGRRWIAVWLAAVTSWTIVVDPALPLGLPEPPAQPPDILSTTNGRQVHGHVSGRRSTHDGRVRVKGSGKETGSGRARRWFYTTRTEIFEASIGIETAVEIAEKQTVLRRICEPEEVASAALFLASADSSFVNGETLFVDNGMLVGT